jgi:Predicted membrane protein
MAEDSASTPSSFRRVPILNRTLHAFRSATTVANARPAYAAGFRASLATVIPLAAGQLLDRAGAATWMSLGGFNAALSDRGGSYNTRAGTMAALMAASATTAMLATIVSGHFVATLIATFIVAFITSAMRVWGSAGVSIGGASLSVYVVALAIPATHLGEVLERAGYILAGGLWAMAIALVLWPLRPYRPARVAIANAYSSLADYVAQLAVDSEVRHTSEWPIAFAPAHTTNVRTALEHASTVLLQLRRGRPGAAERGERLLVLMESADQIFGHVVALGETLAALRGEGRVDAAHDACIAQLREMAATARLLAAAVVAEQGSAQIAVSWSGEPVRAAIAACHGSPSVPQYEHAATILDRAAQFASVASSLVQALNDGGTGPSSRPPVVRSAVAEDVVDDSSWWTAVRAVLSPDSLIVRFALRVAVVTTLAVALTEQLELKRGYWVTITVIVILQPYTGVTLTRAVQRVVGTVLGGLLAAGLGAYFHDPRAILVIATVFVACCVALLPVNYGAFSVFLTPTFVLLAETSAGDWHLAGTRVMNTLLGGALALGGARFLWPIPERKRFPAFAATALLANRDYVDYVLVHYDDRSAAAGEAMRALRRAAGLAAVNAEESLQRALGEAHGDTRRLTPALTYLAYTRRYVASVAALAISRHSAEQPTAPVLEQFRTFVNAVLADLADALTEGRSPRPLPAFEPETLWGANALVRARVERLARQVGTMHDAVARMLASEAGAAEKGMVLAPLDVA